MPPHSTTSPSNIAISCVGSLSNWYWNAVSRLPKPAMVGLPGWRICVQPLPIEIPKSSVMRFEISPDISSSFAGGMSPVLDQDTVGNDISSATQGSSVASVAGRNRAPTKQWAKAADRGSELNESASAAAWQDVEIRLMFVFLMVQDCIVRGGPRLGSLTGLSGRIVSACPFASCRRARASSRRCHPQNHRVQQHQLPRWGIQPPPSLRC